MSIYNEVLDLQDDNDELRKTLREIRTKANEILSDVQSVNQSNVVEVVGDTLDGLNNIISKIDASL